MTPMQIMNIVRKAVGRDSRTNQEIAKAAGLHPVNLAQFKAGDRDLPLKSLTSLAEVVGVEIKAIPKRRRR